MENLLIAEIVRSLAEGDIIKFMAYVAIFVVIWLEVRGMKNQLKQINSTISDSFAKGEKRFEAIEQNILKIDHRLSTVEQITNPLGG